MCTEKCIAQLLIALDVQPFFVHPYSIANYNTYCACIFKIWPIAHVHYYALLFASQYSRNMTACKWPRDQDQTVLRCLWFHSSWGPLFSFHLSCSPLLTLKGYVRWKHGSMPGLAGETAKHHYSQIRNLVRHWHMILCTSIYKMKLE